MISKEEIHNLAELARLKLTPQEIPALQKDISAILDYVGQVSAVSAQEKGVPYSPLQNIMREDIPLPAAEDLREKLLAEAPRREGDYLVVRKVIEKDE